MGFSEEIAKLTTKYKKRTRAVFRDSALEVVNTAQTPVKQGGRMRVDTNFLRMSGGANLNSLPVGPSENPTPGQNVSGRVTGQDEILILSRWQPGDTFFFGWSASYAAVRESKDAFVRGATEKWPEIVNKNAAKAKARGL